MSGRLSLSRQLDACICTSIEQKQKEGKVGNKMYKINQMGKPISGGIEPKAI